MAESGPAGPTRDPFDNVISIVAGPIAAVIRSVDQLRRGSDELIKGLENFNRTMENLNDTAGRINALLNEFEEPVRAILPQVMRTVNLAEELANRVSGPIDQVVPGLTRLADTLSSPVLLSLPTDLSGFVEAINDLVRRLAPLGQLAESAGGLFGLRIPGITRSAPAPMLTPAGAGTAQPAGPDEGQSTPKPAAKSKATTKRKSPAKRKPPTKRKAAPRKTAAKRATSR
jgi:ABC-type transporter Mla subunit MlaD